MRGAHLNAADNRLIGVGERTALELVAEPFAVRGNFTTGPIAATGQPLQPLGTALKHHGLTGESPCASPPRG